MKIALACDHAGYPLKTKLLQHLKEANYEITDLGSFSAEPVDYPDYGHKIAELVAKTPDMMGISLCGSGNGINMTANKQPGIRSALCWMPEIALLARSHNDANICALPARFLTVDEAIQIVDVFLSTAFEGGRHKRRIDKI
jgi:ribose 5-phosphate isomerase B